jgi:hypothetical protein
MLEEGYLPNLVLVIDSLTPKLEGMLRDLCRAHDITTTYVHEDGMGRAVSHERSIQHLLNDGDLQTLLGKNDTLFLKYLLVEPSGLNLRHKVAHALMRYEDYDLKWAHLLLVALLRIAKWHLENQR